MADLLKFLGEDGSNEDLPLSAQERVSKLEEEVTEAPPVPLKLTTQTISSNSPNHERNQKVSGTLIAAMNCYKYKKLCKEKQQKQQTNSFRH
jgi:hypothetical protein